MSRALSPTEQLLGCDLSTVERELAGVELRKFHIRLRVNGANLDHGRLAPSAGMAGEEALSMFRDDEKLTSFSLTVRMA